MRKRLKNLKVFGKNKYEFYLSFIIVLIGLQMTLHLPHNLNDYFIVTGSLLVAFFCSLNAVRDMEHMNWFEQGLAVLWFLVLLCVIPMAVWGLATHNGVFANR